MCEIEESNNFLEIRHPVVKELGDKKFTSPCPKLNSYFIGLQSLQNNNKFAEIFIKSFIAGQVKDSDCDLIEYLLSTIRYKNIVKKRKRKYNQTI